MSPIATHIDQEQGYVRYKFYFLRLGSVEGFALITVEERRKRVGEKMLRSNNYLDTILIAEHKCRADNK